MTEFGDLGAGAPRDKQTPQLETELPFADADWKLIPFSEITKQPLEPFQVITDIPTITACNAVEEQVGHAIIDPYIDKLVTPNMTKEYAFMQHLEKVLDSRISNYLRPKGFNGSLLNAKAIVLPLVPFDQERAGEFKPKIPKSLTETTAGLRVIYQGAMHSSRGVLGKVLQEVFYYDRTIADPYPGSNVFIRSFGPNTTVRNATEIVTANNDSSRGVAELNAQFALRHLYGAGAPGLGKRR